MFMPLAHVGGVTLEPLQLIGLAAISIAYARRVRTLERLDRGVPGWRQVSFAAGVGVIALGLASPLVHMAEELLSAHMGQHLLIADIGALLIVLGLTGPVLGPLMALRPFDKLRALSHPLVALPLWIADLYIWHISVLYQAALSNELVHALQHTSFISFGILMWMPLVGPLPVPEWFTNASRLGYALGVRLAGTVLGNVFMWSNAVFYPDYRAGEADFGIDPLSDQGTAGVIMTLEGGMVTLAIMAWLMLRWASQDTERQRLLDLALERGYPLDDARARRAVASGNSALLEERIRNA